jgi:hypothetical protein
METVMTKNSCEGNSVPPEYGFSDINPPEDSGSRSPAPRSEYHVVLQTLNGISNGVMTRTTFNDRASFERWYEGTMSDGTKTPLREVYGLVAQGISGSDAADLIASPENTASIISSYLREAASCLNRFDR